MIFASVLNPRGGPTKTTNFLLGAAFLLLSLLIPGELWADTYDFAGTLTSSFGGDSTVTGQFSINFSTNSISAFDFTTPFGTIDSTHYTALALYVAGYLGLDFKGPTIPADELVLWFVTPEPFTSASLYTLNALPGAVAIGAPLEMQGGAVANCQSTIPPGVCTITTGGSTFRSGAATIATPTATPEPSSLAILAIGLLFLFLHARTFRRSVPTSGSSPALSS